MMDAVVQVVAGPFEVAVGELKVDLLRQKVAFRGQPLRLRPIEYRVAEYLALRNGIPISCARLEEHLITPDKRACSNLVAVEVCRLRTKLENAGCYYLPRDSRECTGYVLCVPKTA